MLDLVQPEDKNFSNEVWLPEFKSVRALPAFARFIERQGWLAHWRKHGSPDACLGSSPEPFCTALRLHEASGTPPNAT
jgi:hypothetical protein